MRGAKRSLLVDVAKALGKPVPFQTSADEIAALRAIAAAEPGTYTTAKGKTLKGYCVGTVGFAHEERKRAGILLKDEWKFLGQDYYDPATFTPEHDH